jgi:hypothetical protein
MTHTERDPGGVRPERLRRFARSTGISKGVRATLRRLGFDLVRRHFYSPIPDPAEIPADVWSRESDLTAVEFDVAAGRDFVQRELAAFITEYSPPDGPTGDPHRFYLNNGFYESVDAETLYAMVRRFAPPRIVELGSGMSTLVIADARARGAASEDAQHLVIDPYPRPDLVGAIEEVAQLRPISVVSESLAEFEDLRAGDMLFVDTTHTVKIGSDVNRIVLDVLPRLAPGVFVHFHDIYLPWDYPREFVEDRNFFWAEQYLLQAFLAFNQQFEILFGAHALQRQFPDDLAKLVPSARPGIRPSAFWLRRIERSAAR